MKIMYSLTATHKHNHTRADPTKHMRVNSTCLLLKITCIFARKILLDWLRALCSATHPHSPICKLFVGLEFFCKISTTLLEVIKLVYKLDVFSLRLESAYPLSLVVSARGV